MNVEISLCAYSVLLHFSGRAGVYVFMKCNSCVFRNLSLFPMTMLGILQNWSFNVNQLYLCLVFFNNIQWDTGTPWYLDELY